MRLTQTTPGERVFTIELTETELLDLTSLGYHAALCSHGTYQSLRRIADDAGLDGYRVRRNIVAGGK